MHFRYALRQEALQQMQGMRETSIALNKFSYTAALSACEKGYTAACLRCSTEAVEFSGLLHCH